MDTRSGFRKRFEQQVVLDRIQIRYPQRERHQ